MFHLLSARLNLVLRMRSQNCNLSMRLSISENYLYVKFSAKGILLEMGQFPQACLNFRYARDIPVDYAQRGAYRLDNKNRTRAHRSLYGDGPSQFLQACYRPDQPLSL